VLGVALFGSLAGQANAFMAGMHESLRLSACLLLAAGAAIWRGATSQREGSTLRQPRAVIRSPCRRAAGVPPVSHVRSLSRS
jgi:hypothetical protein